MSKQNVEIAAFVGLDWADQKHVVTLQVANSDERHRLNLDHTPEALQSWIQSLRDRFAGKPVAIAVEQRARLDLLECDAADADEEAARPTELAFKNENVARRQHRRVADIEIGAALDREIAWTRPADQKADDIAVLVKSTF